MGKTRRTATKTQSQDKGQPIAEPSASRGELHDQLRSADGLEEQEALLRPSGGKKQPPARPDVPHPKQPVASIQRSNAVTADRLDKGVNAVSLITEAVDGERKTHEAKLKARNDAIAANSKRNFFKKLAGKGKQRVPPAPPKRDHTGAKAALAHAMMAMSSQATSLRKITTKASPKVLPVAGRMVDRTADEMLGKVNLPIIDSTRDLAVGLREGDQAMLDRALKRGGHLNHETLKVTKMIAQNQGANVFTAEYLGMAPVAYKVSKQAELFDREDDATLKEHAVMREVGGTKNTLRAGGRTLGGNRRGFIMELAKKGDLAGVAEQTQSMPLAERMEVWKHLMRGGFTGLDKLHKAGFVHGDVKNENFLLGDDHEAKLMDFGTTDREGDTAMSVGTAQYMAPEVGVGGKVSKAADVWSMGESLLRGLFAMNSSAFAGRSTTKVFNQEKTRQADLQDGAWLTQVQAKVKGLPGAAVFMDFVKKIMAMDPKDRLTAESALQHDFLALKRGERNKGKDKLAEHLAREG